jgi:phosphohistidine phosphatase
VDIYILRHGKAEDAGPGGDADRQLTKKGRDECLAVAHWIASQELRFDLIAASPLARAQETAAIVADVLGAPEKMANWKVLVPGGNPDTVCRELGRHPEGFSILLVGHEPLLSSLIGRIIAGNDHAGIVMTKGALAKIRNYSFHQRPSGKLHWLLTAKQMAGTGEKGQK